MRLDPDRFAAVVAGTIKAAISGLAERVKALEDRGVIHGKDGAPGPPGERGEPGPSGKDGKDGQDGFPGVDGKDGEQGPPGPEGDPGRDGRDGQPGVPGPPGEKGLDGRDGINGKDGVDGLHGKDGLGFDDLTVEYDGDQKFTFKFVRGDRVKAFPLTVPVLIYKGLFDPSVAYMPGHTVTWGASMWTAMQPVRGIEPGALKSDSVWALSVQRGRQGKEGNPGPMGPQGKQGPMGPQGRSGY